MSALCSEVMACDPEPLKKNFAAVQAEEERWQIFSIKEYCIALQADATAVEPLENLKVVFNKGLETNAMAKGTIQGCLAEQIIEAACSE
jgi:hypothetical protein